MTKKAVADELLGASTIIDTQAQAGLIVDQVFDAVKAIVERGETVQIRGFGSFSMKDKKGRVGRNPRTGEPLNIPARREMAFKLPRRKD